MPVSSQLIKDFTQSSPDEFQQIVGRLVKAIERVPTKLDAVVKWRQLTFARNGDFHHWVCAIALTKKSVNLLFHYGSLLDDRNGVLVAGESKFLRKVAYATCDQIDEAEILGLVAQAIDKNQDFKDNWKSIQAEGR